MYSGQALRAAVTTPLAPMRENHGVDESLCTSVDPSAVERRKSAADQGSTPGPRRRTSKRSDGEEP
jgi:hypothetical protein